MILSDKSSGSSILQNVLAEDDIFKKLNPGKFYDESKYWIYAVAILKNDLQPPMRYSYEFPISRKKALEALNNLMKCSRIKFYFNNNTSLNDIFLAWQKLCERHKPIFLEKSPHHLHSWEALNLIIKFMNKVNNVEMKFIGLIRNPMDTLYSMWKRWYAIPELAQYEWLRAYKNLLKFKSIVGEKLLLIKYEELVKNSEKTLITIYDFLGLDFRFTKKLNLHNRSLLKWKNDTNFGFNLDTQVLDLAHKLGYDDELLINNKKNYLKWTLIKILYHFKFKEIIFKKTVKTNLLKLLSLLK